MTDGDIDSTTPLATGGPGAFGSLHQVTQTSTHVSLGPRLHLPPFTPKSATAWFQRAEVHFRLNKVTDDAIKADMVMAMLTTDVFDKMSPWLRAQTDSITYPQLKDRLVNAYALPIPVRAQRALDLMMTPLGDTTPEDAWNELIDLLQLNEVDDAGRPKEIFLSREIFLRRLPQNIRAQLEGAEEMETADLVKKAGKLSVANRVARYAATTNINAVDVDDNEDLEPDINAVHARKPFHQRSQRPPRQRQQQPQRQQQQQPYQQQPSSNMCPGADVPPWCFYHKLWGSNARKCKQPCSYPKN